MSENLLMRFSTPARKNTTPMEILTDREFEVFRLLGQGAMNKEISQKLHVSAKTVAVHSANIRRKLRLKTTARLIRFGGCGLKSNQEPALVSHP